MTKRSLAEQFDQAVEAILARRDAAAPAAHPKLAALLRIAADLRDLPREDFQARLKSDLERKASMTTGTETVVRQQTLTPYLTVHQAAELIEFVKQAFGAEELCRGTGSAGGIHAEVRLGDSTLMIGGGGAWRGTPTPAELHYYVEDADSVYRRALAAGAKSIEEPVDQPYGDREAGVEDLAGNLWWIASRQVGGPIPPGLHSVTPFLHPRGAGKMMEFLKQAFGAEEVDRGQSPEGVILHATVKIGNSMLEIGEAHGEYQPRPTTIYLVVKDADAAYRRALAAGAAPMSEPADQTYGVRMGGVQDPFGNSWYVASPLPPAGT